MISIKFTAKNNDLKETINALLNFKGIFCEIISENIATITMPQNYYEIFSHSLEYWGIIELI